METMIKTIAIDGQDFWRRMAEYHRATFGELS